jgi:hypothetical protein
VRRISRAARATCLALTVAAIIPAASEAASLVFEDGVGLTYRASSGETNHLVMNPFAGEIDGVSIYSMTLQDDGARLKQLNQFCLPETPLRCPTVATYAYMGNGDDFGMAAPYFRDAFIWGQGGDDDIAASGRDHAEAYGWRRR